MGNPSETHAGTSAVLSTEPLSLVPVVAPGSAWDDSDPPPSFAGSAAHPLKEIPTPKALEGNPRNNFAKLNEPASVAQRKSSSVLRKRLGVRIPPGAPLC